MANNETLNASEEVAAATVTTTEAPKTKKKLSKKAKLGIAIGAGVAAIAGFGAIVVSKCLKKNKDDDEILVVESAE